MNKLLAELFLASAVFVAWYLAMTRGWGLDVQSWFYVIVCGFCVPLLVLVIKISKDGGER